MALTFQKFLCHWFSIILYCTTMYAAKSHCRICMLGLIVNAYRQAI